MLKRAFDLVVSLIVILMALPVWVIVATAIKLDSPGPVFYRGARIGKGGKPFTLYKFRTMIADAPQRGPGTTHGNDPRITCVGRVLRKLKIDEMPQLINVLKGEMSIVGPLLCRGARERGKSDLQSAFRNPNSEFYSRIDHRRAWQYN